MDQALKDLSWPGAKILLFAQTSAAERIEISEPTFASVNEIYSDPTARTSIFRGSPHGLSSAVIAAGDG